MTTSDNEEPTIAPGSPEPSMDVPPDEEERETRREVSLFVRVAVMLAVLAAGVLAMVAMIMLKEVPAEAQKVERALAVDTSSTKRVYGQLAGRPSSPGLTLRIVGARSPSATARAAYSRRPG